MHYDTIDVPIDFFLPIGFGTSRDTIMYGYYHMKMVTFGTTEEEDQTLV